VFFEKGISMHFVSEMNSKKLCKIDKQDLANSELDSSSLVGEWSGTKLP